jgi:AcrR family transcriptional regulator
VFGSSRRSPRQARAKQTIDVVVEAAARVFTEVGLEQATTNRIAEVAGVSVGSLYQYFPSKHALLSAIFDRESERLQQAFLRIAGERGLDDVPAVIRAYVAETLDVFERNAPLYRMLLEEVPRFAGLGPTHEVDVRAARALRLLLEAARARIAPVDLDVASRLLVRTLRYNTLAVLREPLVGQARDAFIEELSAMLANYLFGPRPPFGERYDD